MKTNINIGTLAGGAVGERLNIELQKVAENILDPNTEWKKARKVTLTITLKPDEEREIALVGVDVKTTPAPAHGIATKLIFGVEGNGNVVAAELASGMKDQMMIDNDGDIADDKGNKVSYLERKQSQGGN
ncbi:hypothetical protein [Paenibacillus macquariensis]|uniref:Replication terminator protein n=1 Tax=Paenibacillus macquariensis TaxID=948756 RepID=A0ABY1KEW5_9BACL|nr:hypothetical protein [Paenibacillus macquariensis]MEC0092480.1 replication terminator protein [Paenibacillus macquariensis]OAB35438.1 hypothetical protein PMSM_09280 [Paenibacillus macquariensis subsp. macquariensis]SIR72611.1 hypothetical protein SAMN05421578_1485 [Paenibacillus macquariensis]